MRALTVYAPWSHLIIAGAKPYEFRSWDFSEKAAFRALIGERIIIHASARKIVEAEVEGIIYDLEDDEETAKATCLYEDKARPVLEAALRGDLPLGRALGTVELGHPRVGWDIAAEFGLPAINDSDRKKHSNFGWPMLRPREWSDKLTATGRQGFWNWPGPIPE